jgi:hypothetical protein
LLGESHATDTCTLSLSVFEDTGEETNVHIIGSGSVAAMADLMSGAPQWIPLFGAQIAAVCCACI